MWATSVYSFRMNWSGEIRVGGRDLAVGRTYEFLVRTYASIDARRPANQRIVGQLIGLRCAADQWDVSHRFDALKRPVVVDEWLLVKRGKRIYELPRVCTLYGRVPGS